VAPRPIKKVLTVINSVFTIPKMKHASYANQKVWNADENFGVGKEKIDSRPSRRALC